MTNHQWLGIPAMANRYKVSPKTIRRWMDKGDLPRPARVGPRLKWRSDVIERWEAEQMKKAGE